MNVDIEDKSPEKYKSGTPPKNYLLTGSESSADELSIYINEDTLFKVDSYLASDINKELGGVFLGDVYVEESGKRFLFIDNYVHALHTTASVSRLTFTHETWDYINAKIDKEFHGKRILGWYHSHPGHTVFMSGYDTFIQENFFNMDFMTAYIYDPTINERAFFIWKEGKIVKSKGYYSVTENTETPLYKNEAAIPKTVVPPLEKESYEEFHNYDTDTSDPVKKKNIKEIILFILIAANLVLTVILLINYYEISKERIQTAEMNKEVAEMKNDYKSLNQKLENYIIENELKKSENVSTIDVNPYIVNEGDTFEKIAMNIYRDSTKSDTIMKTNNMKSSGELSAGKIISIPVLK